MPVARSMLWVLTVAWSVLPALSILGYPVYSLEYVTAAVVAGLAGLLIGRWVGDLRAGGMVLGGLVFTIVMLYFGGAIRGSVVVMVPVLALLGGFVLFALRDTRNALTIAGYAAAAHIAMAVVSTPTAVRVAELAAADEPAVKNDRPSVVHLVMDEAAGLAAIPTDAVPASEVDAMARGFVNRGFVVFKRAYTVEMETHLSLARLFNRGRDDPQALVVERKDPKEWHLKSAEGLEAIARSFAIDATYPNYINLGSVLKGKHKVRREAQYDGSKAYHSLLRNHASLADRAFIAVAMLWDWYADVAGSPLIGVFRDETGIGRAIDGYLTPASLPHSVVSRDILADFEDRLARELGRSTYAYAHILLPHFPFVFDARCRLLPPPQWRVNFILAQYNAVNDTAARRRTYRSAFDQAVCANTHILGLADKLQGRPDTSDAVMIVHGDHGARIGVNTDHHPEEASRYSKEALRKDLYGTFFAVRIPGVAGRLVERPARVSDIYHALLAADFRSLDIEALPDRRPNPYSESRSVSQVGAKSGSAVKTTINQ